MPRTMFIEAEEVTYSMLGQKKTSIVPIFTEDLDPLFSEIVETVIDRVKKKEIKGLKEVLVFSPSIFYDEYRIYGDLLKLIIKEIDIKLPRSYVIGEDTIYRVRFEVNFETIQSLD